MSEDSLYLNVNTAAKSPHDRLPVMVWVHGGGLDSGSGDGPEANSPALPRHGVVVVTLNHRLGALGLLAYPDLWQESHFNASGNYGLLDIIAALQWVQNNIAAFGGDPTRVTITGQGGGAQKVIWLLASPLAKGLFQRAIVEAGTNRHLADNNTRVDTEEEAVLVSRKFLARVGARDAGDLTLLRAKTWQQVVDAMPSPPIGAETVPASDARMHVTIDAWSLTDHSINIFDEGLGSKVPVLIGADAGELGVLQGYSYDWLPAFAKHNDNVYVYRFAHVPGGWRDAGVEAPHGTEVRYQFGYLEGAWHGPAGAPRDAGVNQDDRVVAENTMRMWVSFAAHGNPSVPGLIDWPAFSASAGKDSYVNIDVKPEVQSGFLQTFAP